MGDTSSPYPRAKEDTRDHETTRCVRDQCTAGPESHLQGEKGLWGMCYLLFCKVPKPVIRSVPFSEESEITRCTDVSSEVCHVRPHFCHIIQSADRPGCTMDWLSRDRCPRIEKAPERGVHK